MESQECSQSGLVSCHDAGTISGLFRNRVARSPDAGAYREFDEDAGRWRDFSWTEIAGRVDRFKGALAGLGLDKGDRVGVLLKNGVDWVAFDIAAMASGLVVVPLYTQDSPANVAAVLAHASCRLVLLDTAARWASLEPLIGPSSRLDTVWVKAAFAAASSIDQTSTIPILNLDATLRDATADCPDTPGAPEDMATLIYTSGTTGVPKGVMLSHKAILWNAEGVTRFIEPLPSDVFLSLLPLAHAFERTLGYYLPMMTGSTVAYARSVETLRDDLGSVRPTIFLGVPRLYERMAARVKAQAGSNALKRRLLNLTVDIGWCRYEADRGRGASPGFGENLIWPILNWLVARRVLRAFGGRLRVAVSAGAPLNSDVARFLCGLGLPLVEGYGLTEAAPAITATTLEDNLPGSVGRPLHGVEIALGARDELIVRSPSVMLGYWQNPEATAEVLDQSGWLRTGDIAQIHDGRIFIRGRLKDLIVLSTGENIIASDIEAALARDPLFDQVCIVGDGRPCLVAVAVLNPEAWQALAARLGSDPGDPNGRAAGREILPSVQALTRDFSKPSQVRAVFAELRQWTVENAALTPTLKVKRRLVEQRYSKEIAALYQDLETARREVIP